MELPVIAQVEGTSASAVTVADDLFNCPFNEGLVHQVVTAYLAAGRAGTKAQKTRRMVRGGGIKPWKQKGTGRARSGSIRSPIWRGGGVTFAAQPRDYQQKLNRKMYRAAFRMIFSELIRQQRLTIVDQWNLEAPKTKELIEKLNKLQLTGKRSPLLIVTEIENPHVCLAARNIPNLEVCEWNSIRPICLVAFEQVLMTAEALKKIEGNLV